MKVTKKEVNLLIIVLGIVVIALTYFYGVKKLNEKTEQLTAENAQLREGISALEILQLKQQTYIGDTEIMKGLGESIMAMFPSEMQTEDQILYAAELEDRVGCYFSYISTPQSQNINIMLEPREDNLSGVPDITGAIEAHSTVDPEQILSVNGVLFANSASSNSFVCTYDQFKELVTWITENPDIRSIDNISLSFDNSTGSLTGTMTINYYSMPGNGREYREPSTGVNRHGVDCIFGAVVNDNRSLVP